MLEQVFLRDFLLALQCRVSRETLLLLKLWPTIPRLLRQWNACKLIIAQSQIQVL